MGRGGAEREGDTESKAGSGLRAVSAEPDAGLELMNPRDHDLSRSRTLNRPSRPGAPIYLFLRENVRAHGGLGAEGEGEREFQAVSMLSNCGA